MSGRVRHYRRLIPSVSALTGCCIGVMIAAVILFAFSHDNKPVVFLNDSERLLSAMGALCMLPMLLASLGAIFTAAGVGDVIATLVGGIIPKATSRWASSYSVWA